MNWDHTAPMPGDIVRVRLGLIYHYGIYVSDEEVIQFGYPPIYGKMEKPEDVRVIKTDMDAFRCGCFPERAKLTLMEKIRRNTAEKTVSIARSRIGEDGYDLVKNNCEHFAKACVFGQKKKNDAGNLTAFTKVYYARIPQNAKPGFTECSWRDAEIEACTNREVKLEKQYSYLLVEHALQDAVHLTGKQLHLRKLSSGKMELDGFYCSISHTKGGVAAAVSNLPVGVDLEQENRLFRKEPEKLAQRVLTAKEREQYAALSEEAGQEYLLNCWTQKECLFKASSETIFHPDKWDVTEYQELVTKKIMLDQVSYVLSVYGKGKMSFHEVVQL